MLQTDMMGPEQESDISIYISITVLVVSRTDSRHRNSKQFMINNTSDVTNHIPATNEPKGQRIKALVNWYEPN